MNEDSKETEVQKHQVDIQKQKQKLRANTSIDLQAMTIEPFLPSEYVSDRLRNKFREFAYVLDKEGNYVLDKNKQPMIKISRDIWGAIEIFTQDWRLGNASRQEIKYIVYNLDLCIDILTVLPDEFNRPAFLLLSRSTAVMETSQSYKGFLRNLFNTFFHNQTLKEDTPSKRNFFGMGKKTKV